MIRTSEFDTSSLDVPFKVAPIVSLRALEDGEDKLELCQRGVWQRILSMLRRRHGNGRRSSRQGRELLRFPSDEKKRSYSRGKRWPRWFKGSRICLVLPVLMLFFFGIIHLINASVSLVPVFLDDSSQNLFQKWIQSDQLDSSTFTTHGVIPINCHSHNDYWRRIPLYEALAYGCTGVEADVWLFSDELFVGHNTNALKQDRTFRSMYVDPLVAILDRQNLANDFTETTASKNGVFETAPSQTLVLLVDFKNNGTAIFPYVSAQISAFREKGYLSYFNGNETIYGPITIVATGNAPFDLITANSTYRDIFFDAPLDRMYQSPDNANAEADLEDQSLAVARKSGQGTVGVSSTSHFDSTNSFYASVSFKKSIGFLWFGRITPAQLDLIRGQIKGARERGLKPRYWGTPSWPVGLRNKVWRLLIDEGVEYLNGDDLPGLTHGNWRAKKHEEWI